MTQSILTLNAGSSSLKFSLHAVRADSLAERLVRGQITGIGGQPRFSAVDGHGESLAGPAGVPADHAGALDTLLGWLEPRLVAAPLVAAGHRIVHGGARFQEAVRIDAGVLDELDALVPLARLHQPYELQAVRALGVRRPGVVQVACFDTAFHRTQPECAQRYALPRALTAAGIRRYGFHGLSYAFVASELAREWPHFGESRTIVAHLGSGASLCAMRAGRSVATTMGFTALEGLMMATRAGSIDPGILLYLLEERGMNAAEASRMLHHESGLLGASGITGDMAVLLADESPQAREAVELFVYTVVKAIGAMAACLEGLDALVFTGGVGENSPTIRARICERLRWLGVDLDERANAAHLRYIGSGQSRVGSWVIPTDEELVIARDTLRAARMGAS